MEKHDIIRNDLNLRGIQNPFLQAGILAVVKKESSFKPKSEYSYRNTSNDRLKRIFVTRLKNVSDQDLTRLKANDQAFFNKVYGGMIGNEDPEDGYKYRGRGLNQLTGKANYKNFGDSIGLDLVKSPDLVNTLPVASKITASFFDKVIKTGLRKGSFKQYGVDTLADINTPEKGLMVAFQSNAGLRTNLNNSFFRNSIAKTKETLKDFLGKRSNSKNIVVGLLLITGLAYLFKSDIL